jgi:hypothetical protein
MRSKCLWKMLCYQDNDSEQLNDEQLVDPSEVIHCCVHAIKYVPERKSGQEPIFEPHYKLVSIVFKLVPKYLEESVLFRPVLLLFLSFPRTQASLFII